MMRIPRIYHEAPITLGQPLTLGTAQTRHLLQALRLKSDDYILLFGPEGGDILCKITHTRKQLEVLPLELRLRDLRSPLCLEIGQGLARGEKMDFVVQKAVELGVARISPLFTDHSNVKLDEKRQAQRLQHWQHIAISACEQCGRADLPGITQPQNLSAWLTSRKHPGLILDPDSTDTLSNITLTGSYLNLLIGPEGGLSNAEIALARAQGFQGVRLGPRILRTETAALCAISILQARFGDL